MDVVTYLTSASIIIALLALLSGAALIFGAIRNTRGRWVVIVNGVTRVYVGVIYGWIGTVPTAVIGIDAASQRVLLGRIGLIVLFLMEVISMMIGPVLQRSQDASDERKRR